MTAYNATPTSVLYDLLREQRAFVSSAAFNAWVRTRAPVAVALWELPRDDCRQVTDPSTAVVTMSAALYVRLFPCGHYGPTVTEGAGDLWGPTVLDGGKS